MVKIRDVAPCWCGDSSWIVQLRTRKFGLLLCPHCQSSRIDPRPLSNKRESPRFYSAYYDAEEPASCLKRWPIGRTSRFWQVARQIPVLQMPGSKALDFGCGEGRLCAELSDDGWQQVYGIDVSKTRVARARQRFPGITFIDCPLIQAGLPKRSFDLIVADNVVEHLPHPLEELTQCRTMLSDSGRLVLITPNLESGNFRLLGRHWSPELAPHVHVYLFRPASLARLVEAAGLEVEALGSFHTDIRLPRFTSLKSFVWMSIQAAGELYSRVVGSGAMVYVVARRPQAKIGWCLA